jgi:antitoxin component YwqK of YwqJK toxin-antitoxin module
MRNYILILLFMPLISLAQDLNKVDSQGRKQGEWIKKREGSKIPHYKGQFKDGKPYGVFVYYYESGKVKSKLTYVGNNGVCYAKHYHNPENPKAPQYPMATGKYINQKKDSIWDFYDQFGYPLSKEEYKNDNLHGEYILYFTTVENESPRIANRILEKSYYKNGLNHGLKTRYYPSGKTQSKGNWIDGNPDGLHTHYSVYGTKQKEVRYKAAVKHGWAKFYDDQGVEVGKNFYWYGEELKGEELESKLAELKAERDAKREAGKN